MNTQRFYIILFFQLFFLCLHAQTDTILYVPTVEVQALKVREESVGAVVTKWDSVKLKEVPFLSVGDFLQRNSNVYLKSYGANSLSTLSVRGASASQTLVLWNGLPVQSSMLGNLDLSLLPSSFMDEMSLEAGGNSSSWGSGAVGGVLAFAQNTSFKNRFSLDYLSSFGSFGKLDQQLSLQFGNRFFQSRTQVLYQKATNNIRYSIAPNSPKITQKNARFEQPALLQTFAIRPNIKNNIALHIWLQKSFKEIPPTITQTKSEAFQIDQFKRFLIEWKYLHAKHRIESKLAFFKEDQNFQDPQILINASNDFTNVLGELNYSYRFNKKHVLEFANTTVFTSADSKAYIESKQLLRSALVASYQLDLSKFSLQANLREEIVNGVFVLPTAYLGMEFAFTKNWKLQSKFTRDFRLPTLNDLYWSPGGNLDLLPESGFGEELGLHFATNIKRSSFGISQTFYNRNVENWILWAPSASASYWQANNVAKVWSWGAETNVNYGYSSQQFALDYTGSFSYNSSTYRINLALPIINKGDQLIYTPKMQFNTQLSLRLKKWSMHYQHLWVGKTAGANDDLDAYHVANIRLSWQYKHRKTTTHLFALLNNIFNQEYMVVERRPSPGINYQIGIQIKFNK